MWWPSPTDQACREEVTEEKQGRRTPSVKRHSAWGLQQHLALDMTFEQIEVKNAGGSDYVTRASPLTQTDVIVSTDVTSVVDRKVNRSGELTPTQESPTFDLLFVLCST